MSASELKKELIALQKTFLGGAVGKLKKHELDHRLAVFKKAMELKIEMPQDEPAKAGPPKARHVKTEIVSIDAETTINKPIAPVGGKVHSARYTKKAKAPDAAVGAAASAAPDAAPAAPAEKPKKVKITPPKVVLSEEVPVKIVKKRVPKPAAEKPAAPAAAPAPAPALVTIEKLPGGVKRVVTDSITLA
jgi:hypothetical protein